MQQFISIRPQVEIDFNIVIAHRGEPMGLWATVHSCEIDLLGSDFNYSYIFVTNGDSEKTSDGKEQWTAKPTGELRNILQFLRKAGKVAHHYHSPEPLAPPVARHIGTKYADGKYLFFFDNHCLVARNYFSRAIQTMKNTGADMLHSATRFFAGEDTSYEYQLILERNFWGEAKVRAMSTEPYRIAASGHGGFVVTRSAWEQVGGYWDGFVGYGGEEIYFDLKMALMGKSNWIDPQVIHYHYAGRRGYARHFTDEYYVNMIACANIIGGSAWMERVYQSFAKCGVKNKSERTMFDNMMIAQERSREHAAWLAGRRQRTLDQQLEYFRQNNISF